MPAPFDHEAAVDLIYRTAAEPALWPETLTRLADYVGALGALLAYSAPVGQSNNFLVTGRLRDDLTRLYLEQYAHNPYALALRRAPPAKAQIANGLVDMPALRRSAFHADILAPQTITEQVVFTHASLSHNGAAGGIGFMLGPRKADDAQRVAARVDRMIPHLTRAIDLALALGRHESGVWRLGQLLDAMPGAALLVDRSGGVMRINPAAQALLRAGDGLALIQDDGWRLVAQAPDEARALAGAIAQALSATRGEDRGLVPALRIARPSGRPSLLVMVTPLPPASFSLFEAVDGGARALVQIVDAQRPSLAQAEMLREAAGLTAMEARVAALIGAGSSIPQTAASLGVSPNTVKTHLTRCFDKVGVHSQVALARLIASIPGLNRRDK